MDQIDLSPRSDAEKRAIGEKAKALITDPLIKAVWEEAENAAIKALRGLKANQDKEAEALRLQLIAYKEAWSRLKRVATSGDLATKRTRAA